MAQTLIEVGESEIALFYRLVLPDGTKLVFGAVALDVQTATRVIGNVTVEYSLFVPILPPGAPWMFLRGFKPGVDYITGQTGIEGSPAALYAELMPLIAALAPADDIAEAADTWYNARPR
jgi:hypothetical protein